MTREKSNRTIVFEDLEYIIPGEKLNWDAIGDPPCTEQDKLITSSITMNDHLWPCEYAFSSWHLVQTHMINENTYVEQRDTRPYIADILLAGFSFTILISKRKLEKKPRSHIVWMFDVSKQIIGGTLIHLINIASKTFIFKSYHNKHIWSFVNFFIEQIN